MIFVQFNYNENCKLKFQVGTTKNYKEDEIKLVEFLVACFKTYDQNYIDFNTYKIVTRDESQYKLNI